MTKRIPIKGSTYSAILDNLLPELSVYSSISDPDGRAFGGGGYEGRMETTWGFKNFNAPILEAKTTWDIEPIEICDVFTTRRANEKSLYWLHINETPEDTE